MTSGKNGNEQKIILTLKYLQAEAERLYKSSKSVLESYHRIVVAIDNGRNNATSACELRPLRGEEALANLSKQAADHSRTAIDSLGKIQRQLGSRVLHSLDDVRAIQKALNFTADLINDFEVLLSLAVC